MTVKNSRHAKPSRLKSAEPHLQSRPSVAAPTPRPPENAERELKVAFNRLMESGVVWLWQREKLPDVQLLGIAPEWPARLYRTASALYRNGERLAAERWARSCRHFATALWHEAKIAWLYDPSHPKDLDEYPNAQVEYQLHETPDTTRDLIHDLEGRPLPVVPHELPGSYAQNWIEPIIRLARKHLEQCQAQAGAFELVQCEHLKAAEEWARTAEEISGAFAIETDSMIPSKKAA